MARHLTEEQKERRRQQGRERYANNPKIRARYQEKARARIPEKCEYEKVRRRKVAEQEGRAISSLGKSYYVQDRAHKLIMEHYNEEARTLRKAEATVDDRVKKMMDAAKTLRAYYALTPEQRLEQSRLKQAKRTPEQDREYNQRYQAKAKAMGTWQAMHRRYARTARIKNRANPLFRAKENMRKRFRDALGAYRHTGRDKESMMIGCSWSFFHEWITKQFKKGMTWANYGSVWHIDHIEPLASFDVMSRQDMRRAWHYTNLRPLCAKENMLKSDSIITHQPELILHLI